jgi:multicomponent Na+:H+ antiporter subunit G
MTEWISSLFLFLGATLLVLAAVGTLRLPDFYLRTASAAKAGGVGSVCILLAAAIHFADFTTSSRAIVIGLFIFLTIPVSAHLLGRAAYRSGVPFWRGTGRIDLPNHQQSTAPEDEKPPEE